MPVPTVEQLLARMQELRKEYQDDEEDETYLALHHAFLFLSYRVNELKEYLAEAERLADD